MKKRMQELAGIQSNQTAVEWLVSQLPLGVKDNIMDKIEEAKQMEEQYMGDAFMEGKNNGMDISHPLSHTKEISFNEWYTETFRNN